MVGEIDVQQLKDLVDAGRAPRVIDVREAHELEISSLPFAEHMPMGEVPARYTELDPQAPLVVMCRSGGRSMQVARFLESRGFRSVSNLTGGILAWGERIDPSLRPY
ncbi:MAG: sulfurtransferase [Gammaproteobacteria bacterium]|nr:sulfurtransferase [Gammaproteobacteria bacterium]